MAIRVTKEFLFKKMEKHQLPYYIAKDGTNVIARNEENTNVNESIEELTELFENATGDTINVSLSDRTGKEKSQGGRSKTDFVYSISLRTPSTINGNAERGGLAASQMELLNSNFDLRLNNHLKDLEIAKLKEEAEEGVKDNKGILGMVEPYLPALLGSMFPAAPTAPAPAPRATALAGVQEISEAKQHLNESLKAWQKVDGDFLNVIKAVVKIATTQPAQYNMYKNILLNNGK
jgi:hypothetical protein